MKVPRMSSIRGSLSSIHKSVAPFYLAIYAIVGGLLSAIYDPIRGPLGKTYKKLATIYEGLISPKISKVASIFRNAPISRFYWSSLAIQLAIAPFVIHDWDGYVFIRAAEDLIGGQTPYQVAEETPSYIYNSPQWPPLGSWYAYPPIPILLMTPGVAIAHALGGSPWMIRTGLKVPFILGNLALARVGAEVLRVWGKDGAARKFEVAILFNPYLWFIAAAWGMFDVWIAVMVLACIYFVEKGMDDKAAIALGIGSLVKIFPIFLGPAFAAYIWMNRSSGWRAAARFTAISAGTFMLVCLPFYIQSPWGLANQLLLMHMQRPAQGLSFYAAFGELRNTGQTGSEITHALLSIIPPFIVNNFPMAGMLSIVTVSAITTSRAKSTMQLSSILVAVILGVCIANKVLNEQYLCLPVALMALCASGGDKISRIGYHLGTFGGLFAGLFLGWHIFTFIPYDISTTYFDMGPGEMIESLRLYLDLTGREMGMLAYWIAFSTMLPFVIFSIYRVLLEVFQSVEVLAGKLEIRVGTDRKSSIFASIVVIMLILPTTALSATSFAKYNPGIESIGEPYFPSDGPLVGSIYYMWWTNSAHDPNIPAGNWDKGVAYTPIDGYYTMSAAKMRNDFEVMKEHGVELVLVSFHEYDIPMMPAVLGAAYDQGILAAPLIELGEVYSDPDHQNTAPDGSRLGPEYGYAMRNGTRERVVDFTSNALAFFEASPAAYRPNGELAVFFYDSFFTSVDATPEFQSNLIHHAEEILQEQVMPYGVPYYETLETFDANPPSTYEEFIGGDSYLWRRAYNEVYSEFWNYVVSNLEYRHGNIFAVSGETWNPDFSGEHGIHIAIEGSKIFDSSYMYNPSIVWAFNKQDSFLDNWNRWAARSAIQAQYQRSQGNQIISTVSIGYDDITHRGESGFAIPIDSDLGLTYDLQWRLSMELQSDLIIISTWNEFYEGTVVEPTIEYGEFFLERTNYWVDLVKEQEYEDKPLALMLTNEGGARFYPGAQDPDWAVRLARSMQVQSEFVMSDYTWHSKDISEIGISELGLVQYDLVILESGSGQFIESIPSEIIQSIEIWVNFGGILFIPGSSLPQEFENIWGASNINQFNTSDINLSFDDGLGISFQNTGNRAFEVELSGNSTPIAQFDSTGTPAAWFREYGEGLVISTSFKPTDMYTHLSREEAELFCSLMFEALIQDSDCLQGEKLSLLGVIT